MTGTGRLRIASELRCRREISALVSPAARDLDATRDELLSTRQTLEWERRELELLRARLVLAEAGEGGQVVHGQLSIIR